jgi:hypothetical protein
LVAAVLAISVYASPVYADSISGAGCSGSGCFGGVWTLEYSLATGTPSPTDYNIFYTVNTAGMTQAGFGDISQIGFKISGQVVSSSIVTSPAGWGTDVRTNQVVNANGCNLNGGGGFICSDAVTNLTVPDGTYSWQFLVDIGNASLMTALKEATIKANGAAPGKVLSQSITLQPVPEPTTLLLVGTMLAGVGVWSRKRWLKGKAA